MGGRITEIQDHLEKKDREKKDIPLVRINIRKFNNFIAVTRKLGFQV